MDILHHDVCELCGANQQDRPLVQMAFVGEQICVCLGCMPTACKGLDFQGLAEKLREKRSQDLNSRPLAKPGLRY